MANSKLSSLKVGWLITGVIMLGVITAFTLIKGGTEKFDFEKKYTTYLETGNYAEFERDLKRSYVTKEYDREIYGACQAIAKNATLGMQLIDAVSKKNDLISRSLSAELLMRSASGIDARPWRIAEMNADRITTEQIADRAIQYLEDEDPFIRGLAEFAIAIRIGMENAESLRVFPGEIIPQWYPVWKKSMSGDKAIELDYTRQATERGLHRSVRLLQSDTDRILAGAKAIVQKISETNEQDNLKKAYSILGDIEKIAGTLASSDNLLDARKIYVELRFKVRDLVMQSPDFDFEKTVFALHHAFHDFGNITNGGKSYVIKPGGDLYVKKGFQPSSQSTALIGNKLGPGHTRGYELHYDADRLIFSFAPQPHYYDIEYYESDQGFDDKVHGMTEPNHIYELDLTNNNISQLTSSTVHIDIEPTYLPNGDIVFSSDRGSFGSQCSGNYFQNKRIVNQYRMSKEGENIRALTNNKDFDRYNHVLDNGQIVYTRWEYQERHLYYVHNLWVSRPDGSMSDAIYKQHINHNSPMALRDARQIHGTNLLVAIGCGHHEWEQGAVMIIDPNRGTNDPSGMTLVTPYISAREGGIGSGEAPASGGIMDNGGLYQQPYALSKESFLVAFSYNYPRGYTHGFNFGLYYIDVFGNKELIHRDPVLSVWYPVPLKERPVPPIIPDAPEPDKDYATLYMTDVYQGMDEVEKGEIKYIRIGHHTHWPAEQVDDQPHNFNHLHYTPSGSWSRTVGMTTWSPARVIGTVPVEKDGSAYFKVPSEVPVYFQALDENMLEVRRMRSFVTFNKGETRGCTGCHETRDEAPVALHYVPSALSREPSHPVPPSWGDVTLPDFEEHIQPIFANNCASCHSAPNPAGGLEFSTRKIDGYYQSYRTLFGLNPTDPTPVQELKAFQLTFGENHNVVVDKAALQKMERNEYPGQLITISNKFSDNSVTEVRQFGSGNSKLVDALLSAEHQKHVVLSEEDWIDLITWIDLNAPYWGAFFNKEPARDGGRPYPVKLKIGKSFADNQ